MVRPKKEFYKKRIQGKRSKSRQDFSTTCLFEEERRAWRAAGPSPELPTMRRLRTLPWLALLGVLRVAAGDASLDDSTAVTESATPAYAIDDAAYGSDGLERYIDESCSV